MKTKSYMGLLLALISSNAYACDNNDICSHIHWCLTDPTVDQNDKNNLNWSIDHNSGLNVRFNTEKCQKSRGTKYDVWSRNEKACSDDEMIGNAKNARSCGL